MNDSDVGFEPWLRWLLSAFLPLAGMFFVPDEFRLYCVAVAGILFVIGVVTLVRGELRKRAQKARDA